MNKRAIEEEARALIDGLSSKNNIPPEIKRRMLDDVMNGRFDPEKIINYMIENGQASVIGTSDKAVRNYYEKLDKDETREFLLKLHDMKFELDKRTIMIKNEEIKALKAHHTALNKLNKNDMYLKNIMIVDYNERIKDLENSLSHKLFKNKTKQIEKLKRTKALLEETVDTDISSNTFKKAGDWIEQETTKENSQAKYLK